MSIVSYTFIGAEAGDQAGISVTSIFDIDGDGVNDFLIGASRADGVGANSGAAYLLSGSELASADAADGTVDGLIDLSNVAGQTNSYEFLGEAEGDQAGHSVALVPDFDGDGIVDIVIGAPLADGDAGSADNGAAYLISSASLGAADAADGGADGQIDLGNVAAQAGSYKIIGTDEDDRLGQAVGSVGDVDGDGIDDLFFHGARAGGLGNYDSEGYLVSSGDLAAADAADGADGVIDASNIEDQDDSYRFTFKGNTDAGGYDFASVGDIDADGLDDFIVTAYATDNYTGNSYLVTAADLAAVDGLDGVDGVVELSFLSNLGAQSSSYTFVGTDQDYNSGQSITSMGDLDGDGIADFVIGSPQADSSASNAGEAHFISSRDLASADAADGSIDRVINLSNIAAQDNSYQFVGGASSDLAGNAVASAGDVDGDGVDDFLISAYFADTGNPLSGDIYLLAHADLVAADLADGTQDGLIDLANVSAQDNSYKFHGAGRTDLAGASISSAGDIDGDGKDDLLIAAYLADDGGVNSGEVYYLTAADFAAADDEGNGQDSIISLDTVRYDGIVSGTSSGDVIDTSYLGDGQLDLIDQNDSRNRDDDDVIAAGEGDDTIVASLGDDTIDGGSGTDTYKVSATPGGLSGAEDTISVAVNDDGDGTVQGTRHTVSDTVTSVERFDAGEHPDEDDTITISDTGAGYTTSDISGLDTGAADGQTSGTFTSTYDSTVVNFGPGEALSYDDIITKIDANNGDKTYTFGGTFAIDGGDESGQVGNIGFTDFENINFTVVCFARGTLIETKSGPVAVELLTKDDQVKTLDRGYQPIRWIGSTNVDAIDLRMKPKLLPIRIRAGALGGGLPTQDLSVSPQHRMLVRSIIAERMFGQTEVLITANKLTALDGIDVDNGATSVEYFHMLFDAHEVVYANGAPAESLFTGPEALRAVSPEARKEIATLFPEICEPDFQPVLARHVPSKGKHVKKFIERHHANQKPLLAHA